MRFFDRLKEVFSQNVYDHTKVNAVVETVLEAVVETSSVADCKAEVDCEAVVEAVDDAEAAFEDAINSGNYYAVVLMLRNGAISTKTLQHAADWLRYEKNDSFGYSLLVIAYVAGKYDVDPKFLQNLLFMSDKNALKKADADAVIRNLEALCTEAIEIWKQKESYGSKP